MNSRALSLSAVAMLALTSSALADTLLSDFSNYAFFDLGNTTLGWNTGPVAGNVLLGQNLTAGLSGGNNGGLTNGGVLYKDSTTTISGHLDTQPTITHVAGDIATTSAAAAQAASASAFLAGLTPTQTIANVSSATTFTAAAGVTNVIDVTKFQDAPLTFSGPGTFIINIGSGGFHSNQNMTLTNGALAANILFNIGAGSSFATSGATTSLVGTYLVYDNSKGAQFDGASINGQLIVVDTDLQFVSGADISTFTPDISVFCSPTPIPAALPLFASGLGVMVWFGRRRKRKGAALAA